MTRLSVYGGALAIFIVGMFSLSLSLYSSNEEPQTLLPRCGVIVDSIPYPNLVPATRLIITTRE